MKRATVGDIPVSYLKNFPKEIVFLRAPHWCLSHLNSAKAGTLNKTKPANGGPLAGFLVTWAGLAPKKHQPGWNIIG